MVKKTTKATVKTGKTTEQKVEKKAEKKVPAPSRKPIVKTKPAAKKTPEAKKPAPSLPEIKDFPSIKKGSKETGYITLLQTNLKNRGFYQGEIDGKFGDELEKAVMDFQKALGKPRNGSVGPKTWDAIQKSDVRKAPVAPVAPPPAPKPNIRVVIEGLNRYQAELLVKLFSESMDCHIVI